MREGGCQCGALRYECAEVPLKIYVCHCRECRKQSASAFGITYFVPRAGFRLTRGTPRFWTRIADSGRTLVCAFCADCGSRVWHEAPDTPLVVNVKAGSLDEGVDISEATHIWTSRKVAGFAIPAGAPQLSEGPQ